MERWYELQRKQWQEGPRYGVIKHAESTVQTLIDPAHLNDNTLVGLTHAHEIMSEIRTLAGVINFAQDAKSFNDLPTGVLDRLWHLLKGKA